MKVGQCPMWFPVHSESISIQSLVNANSAHGAEAEVQPTLGACVLWGEVAKECWARFYSKRQEACGQIQRGLKQEHNLALGCCEGKKGHMPDQSSWRGGVSWGWTLKETFTQPLNQYLHNTQNTRRAKISVYYPLTSQGHHGYSWKCFLTVVSTYLLVYSFF